MGNDYKYDNKSKATIDWDGIPPSEGKIASNTVQAQQGVYNFTNLDFTLKPGTSREVKITIKDFDAYGEKARIPFLIEPYKIMISARACIEGEEFTP